LVKSKQMRALACFGEKRVKNFEDVPTFKELGYPNITFYSWYGLLAHKDTPAPILEKLRKLVRDVTSDPAYLDVLEKAGDLVDYADAETTKKAWQKDRNTGKREEGKGEETVRTACKLRGVFSGRS
jgi:tripartite-type tricarboxylate transporter receptor subunit TctC